MPVFETGAFNHSATCPGQPRNLGRRRSTCQRLGVVESEESREHSAALLRATRRPAPRAGDSAADDAADRRPTRPFPPCRPTRRTRRARCATARSRPHTSRTARASRRACSPRGATTPSAAAAARMASTSACAVGSWSRMVRLPARASDRALANDHRADRHLARRAAAARASSSASRHPRRSVTPARATASRDRLRPDRRPRRLIREL